MAQTKLGSFNALVFQRDREAYQRAITLIKKFPGSSAAKHAQERINKLHERWPNQLPKIK